MLEKWGVEDERQEGVGLLQYIPSMFPPQEQPDFKLEPKRWVLTSIVMKIKNACKIFTILDDLCVHTEFCYFAYRFFPPLIPFWDSEHFKMTGVVFF